MDNMLTEQTPTLDAHSIVESLEYKLLPLSVDPAVQNALAQLSESLDSAYMGSLASSSIAASQVADFRSKHTSETDHVDLVVAAVADLYPSATGLFEVDAVPGAYAHPGTVIEFEDGSQALMPAHSISGQGMPFALPTICRFYPHDIVGTRIPRVYSSMSELTQNTESKVLKYEFWSRSEETKRTYRAQWNGWVIFADATGLETLPATPDGVVTWIKARADADLTYSTINLGLQVLKAVHIHYNQPDPCNDQVKNVLDGISTRIGRAQKQVTGFSPEDLDAIEATACIPRLGRGRKLETVGYACRRGCVDTAMVRTAFDALLRISELRNVRWRNLTIKTIEESDVGLVFIEKSKTDRASEGEYQYVSGKTVEALARIRKDAGPDDRIFPFSVRTLRRRIKAAAAAAGLEGRFSGHSGRVGMAQNLAAEDVSLVEIQTSGRWKSKDMPARYTRFQSPMHGAVARLDRKRKEQDLD